MWISDPAMPHIERKDMRFFRAFHLFDSVIVEPFRSLSHTSFIAMMFALFPRAELFSSLCSSAESLSMEHIVRRADKRRVPLRDLRFDLRAGASIPSVGAVHELTNLDARICDPERNSLSPVVSAAFHDKMPGWKILQTLGEGLSAVERLGDDRGISGRQLEENVSADRENRRARCIRV